MTSPGQIEFSEQNATIYHCGAFGVRKVEVRNVQTYVGKYAQHERALFVHFVPKGKRKTLGFVETSGDRSLVVLRGWGHMDPPGSMVPSGSDGNTITKYATFDPRWQAEFNVAFAEYLASSGAIVCADYRPAPQAPVSS